MSREFLNQINHIMTYQYFINAITQHYADFEGRARRSEYWYFTLFSTIISWTLSFGGIAILGESGAYLSTIYSLAILIPAIALGIRRMHDVGKSGWYVLIPIYNLILACTDSTPGTNEYGPNPKGIGNNFTDDQTIKSIGQQ